MKRFIVSAFALLAALCLHAQNNPLDVQEFKLSNGMQVWVNQDSSQPKVYGAVVVKAGGKDCPDTGLAHYLEHLLFKGTTEIGTVDYEAEKVWLDSITVCYNQLAETQDDSLRLVIQKEINRLSIKAADYAIPNEFDLLIARFGGTGLNAGTSYDYTFYYNTFSPQYIAQWCELNSHRMLNPVFRLFQGELETVYEEKNRAADNTMQAPLFKMIRTFSDGNPYSYEVIGSTENLKNPRLGEMMDFFKKYYVGNNMGLILSGNIDAATIQPLLEDTFGRLPAGDPAVKEPVAVPNIQGVRDVKIKAEIPLIKIAVYGFNGPKDGEPDAIVLDLASSLLTNSFSSGLLDSLTTNHKVLTAAAGRVPLFNEMGIAGYLVIPSIPFGSLPKAEKLVREQVQKIKDGKFSDADLEALKLEAARSSKMQLETISSRSNAMVEVMTQNRSWADYLAEVEAIQSITREDVIRVANKYFGENYIRFEKVSGTYPKDKVAAPKFDPIIPKHAGEKSEYARKLEAMPVAPYEPKLLDFKGDVQRVKLSEMVTLYYKQNEVNDIFTLSIQVDEGFNEDPVIPHVASYLNAIGTDSLSIQQFSKAWQNLGTSFSVSSDNHRFNLGITGFDSRFAPSVQLLRHFEDHAKADKESFKELKQGVNLEKKTFLTGGTSNIMQATSQRVFYGANAPKLRALNGKELGKIGADGLLNKFSQLLNKECAIFYCGTLPIEEVAAVLKAELDLERVTVATSQKYLPYLVYDKPTVFFYNLKNSRQAQIMTYQTPAAPADDLQATLLEVLGEYIGGGMYSLMFQEVREFRAMAYSAHGYVTSPMPVEKEKSAALVTSLGTQADKSLAALQLVDSLLRVLPLKESTFTASVQSLASQANNGYPTFRGVASSIHNCEVKGYTEDPNKAIVDHLDEVSLEAMKNYYDAFVAPSPRCLIIVGDREKLPMDKIAEFGEIVELTQKDIYK
ncbi:MAG: insulinase family protein [Bacteroidales bacterium]|nr:insulinase family protein [Bacteroidales bacterium]